MRNYWNLFKKWILRNNRDILPSFTLEEIQQSNQYLYIIGNKVIDATEIIDKHPGGDTCLFKKKGTDIRIDYNFHNKTAQINIMSMIIGVVEK